MTKREERQTVDEVDTAERVAREQLERIRTVDRDWSPERRRDRERVEPASVLVPFDDSAPSCSALEYAFELFPDADVTALLIVDDSSIPAIPNRADGRTTSAGPAFLERVPWELDHAIEIAEECDGRLRTTRRIGSPTQGILEYLKREPVDHVVIGSHCRSGLARILLGSVAEVVVRHSPVPVTVIPASSDGGDRS